MENKTRSGRSRLADLVVHIATIAVAAAALAYLGYHFFEGFSADIETEYATLVTDSDVVPLRVGDFRRVRDVRTQRRLCLL